MNEPEDFTDQNDDEAVTPSDVEGEKDLSFTEWAYRSADAEGTTIDQFLIRNDLVSAEVLYRALASMLNVPFTSELLSIARSFDGETLMEAEMGQLEGSDPEPRFVMAPTGRSFVALLVSASAEAVRLKDENIILTTPYNFARSVRLQYGHSIANKAVHKIKNHAPYLSACQVGMKRTSILVLAILIGLLLCATIPNFWYLFVFSLTLFPGIPSIILKSMALKHSTCPPLSNLILADHELPSYTILVPLYREQKIIPQLIERLKRINYPKAKLDIKILVEIDDIETRMSIMMQQLSAIFDVIVCPAMSPRTKPRALNIGLAYAKSDYIVVYDAEDEPDPNQLKKAATSFYYANRKFGCVQCRLAIDNINDSWISRMFALEYAGLFDALLLGMSKARQPIPLGGTSNHFRRETLEACLAWDSWNVTEDADLGLRLARLGYETIVIDSTTLEEAPNTIKAWTNQRTRWLKGWMQTAIVLSRPITVNGIKTYGMMQFQISVICLASITTALFNPWLVAYLGFIFALPLTDASFSLFEWIQWNVICWVVLFQCGVTYLTLKIGAYRRGLTFYLSDFLGLALYSLLKCFAAWRALWEFIVAPSLWRKTDHGKARTSRKKTQEND
jgi:cellulose synthase/poly-beta-1,6-N-acetylglucosamine synthase-like glycosyltransferase